MDNELSQGLLRHRLETVHIERPSPRRTASTDRAGLSARKQLSTTSYLHSLSLLQTQLCLPCTPCTKPRQDYLNQEQNKYRVDSDKQVHSCQDTHQLALISLGSSYTCSHVHKKLSIASLLVYTPIITITLE